MILLFAGAGASTAVSAEKYPTTAQFFDSLPGAIKGNQLFKHTEAHLLTKSASGGLDIEQVLWQLREFELFLKEASSPKAFAGSLLKHGHFGRLVNRGDSFELFSNVSADLLNHVSHLRNDIHTHVFNVYCREPSAEELTGNWIPLLKALRAHPLEIFTTNYDLVLEQTLRSDALKGVVDVRDGRVGTVLTKLDLSLWVSGGSGRGRLTKLHGSVDWSRRGEEINVGTPGPWVGESTRDAIIYPGFKGSPTQEPFATFHRCLQEALRAARALVFIGYAFRDEYINQQILRYVRDDDVPVVIVNPAEDLPGLPLDGARCVHIRKPFDASAADEVGERVLSAIGSGP